MFRILLIDWIAMQVVVYMNGWFVEWYRKSSVRFAIENSEFYYEQTQQTSLSFQFSVVDPSLVSSQYNINDKAALLLHSTSMKQSIGIGVLESNRKRSCQRKAGQDKKNSQ